MRKILFVCTGNTCRSPMAMAIFNHHAHFEPPEFEYEAVSAGLAVHKDTSPSANASLTIMELYNIDITGYCAQVLSQSDIENAFLVLTMTQSHKNYIHSMFHNSYKKVYTLKEYAYSLPDDIKAATSNGKHEFSPDIADPFGSSLWYYKLCAHEISEAVEEVFKKLKKY